MRTKFSILHPTIRFPRGWQQAWEAWADTCDNPTAAEYLLTLDVDDWRGKRPLYFPWFTNKRNRTLNVEVLANKGRRCYVDAQNTAARAATGDFLITAADDWFPCPHWDSLLNELVPDPLTTEAVIKVYAPHHPDLIIYPILTRAYYERPGRGGCPAGELFYPGYLSMGSDDDLTEYATRDGVVIDAPHMKFDHRHVSLGCQEFQDGQSYEHVQSPEAWRVKDQVLPRRRLENFSK